MHAIVCGVDDESDANPTASFATDLAGRLGAELILVNVSPDVSVPERPVATYNERREEAEAFELAGRMQVVIGELEAAGAPGINMAVEFGDTAETLAALAAKLESPFIIVGDHERTGLDRLVLGSTTAEVIGTAPCPVVVFPSNAVPATGEALVCGLDDSDAALAVTRVAARLAEKLELKLVLVHALERAGEVPGAVDAALAAAREQLPVDAVELIAQPEKPVELLTKVSGELDAELIVVGSRRLGPVRRALLGSVSTALLQKTDDRPVVVVPDETAAAVAE